MNTVITEKQKHTYDDYLQTNEGGGYELISGLLVEEPAPGIFHQRSSRKIGIALDKYITENNRGELFFAPCDVYFDYQNVLQPDIIFISNEQKEIITKQHIKGAPDLVVEIVSVDGFFRDTVEKKKLYEIFGVKEYWIVLPEKKIIEVYVLEDNTYKINRTYQKDDTLESMVLKGFKLELKYIF